MRFANWLQEIFYCILYCIFEKEEEEEDITPVYNGEPDWIYDAFVDKKAVKKELKEERKKHLKLSPVTIMFFFITLVVFITLAMALIFWR